MGQEKSDFRSVASGFFHISYQRGSGKDDRVESLRVSGEDLECGCSA